MKLNPNMDYSKVLPYQVTFLSVTRFKSNQRNTDVVRFYGHLSTVSKSKWQVESGKGRASPIAAEPSSKEIGCLPPPIAPQRCK